MPALASMIASNPATSRSLVESSSLPGLMRASEDIDSAAGGIGRAPPRLEPPAGGTDEGWSCSGTRRMALAESTRRLPDGAVGEQLVVTVVAADELDADRQPGGGE